MTAHRNSPERIAALLTTPATWAVVGLSTDRSRIAYPVSQWLIERLGMRVVPVHPRAETVFGQSGYASLADIPDGERIAVVDCFVNSHRVGAVVEQAIAQRERLGIEAVWLQLGVIDEEAARAATDAGLTVVMDTCPKIEYPAIARSR